MAKRFGIGIIPYSPLGGGLLAGGILKRPKEGRRSEDIMKLVVDQNKDQVQRWEAFCGEFGEAPAPVALAWLLSNPIVTSPIIGPRTVNQVEDAMRALDIQLNKETIKRIESIWPLFGAKS